MNSSHHVEVHHQPPLIRRLSATTPGPPDRVVVADNHFPDLSRTATHSTLPWQPANRLRSWMRHPAKLEVNHLDQPRDHTVLLLDPKLLFDSEDLTRLFSMIHFQPPPVAREGAWFPCLSSSATNKSTCLHPTSPPETPLYVWPRASLSSCKALAST